MMLPGGAQHEGRAAFAPGHVSQEPSAKEELLGGEFVVRIEDATVRSTTFQPHLQGNAPGCTLLRGSVHTCQGSAVPSDALHPPFMGLTCCRDLPGHSLSRSARGPAQEAPLQP